MVKTPWIFPFKFMAVLLVAARSDFSDALPAGFSGTAVER